MNLKRRLVCLALTPALFFAQAGDAESHIIAQALTQSFVQNTSFGLKMQADFLKARGQRVSFNERKIQCLAKADYSSVVSVLSDAIGKQLSETEQRSAANFLQSEAYEKSTAARMQLAKKIIQSHAPPNPETFLKQHLSNADMAAISAFDNSSAGRKLHALVQNKAKLQRIFAPVFERSAANCGM
ncbi:MAG: hypothetical protein CR957_00320 [Gammaproteobacteria bacterium]|nr:MAG: hypothetical protein CR957_00320 [Gammaproteobacteria bacterium]